MPSAEHVTSNRPKCLGPNLTSVTEVRESTRLDLLSQVRRPFSDPDAVVSPEMCYFTYYLNQFLPCNLWMDQTDLIR